MRWRRPRDVGGRLPSLGQNYAEAHRRYVERIDDQAALWLRTKPFSAPPGHELVECLRVFSHIVARVGLSPRAQVLDVGCGPGWLSEFLARCGYAVTGVDVSEDMVRIARERIASIDGPIGPGIVPVAKFHAMPVLELPWRERFDAAILYDAMHHFDDEVETLRVIRRTLVPGGRVFIHEGVRPTPGSEGERQLVAEMEEYGTLESPFDPAYLLFVLEEAGFTQIARFASVDDLLDVSNPEEELRRLEQRLQVPPMNTVIAFNPVPAELDETEEFAALIEATGPWRTVDGQDEVVIPITVTNAGRCFWPAGLGTTISYGDVTLAPYVSGDDGERLELPRQTLPNSLSRGESVQLELRVPLQPIRGRQAIQVEAVHEGIAWFADYGTQPLTVSLPSGA